jgi:hypothetical protein
MLPELGYNFIILIHTERIHIDNGVYYEIP